MASVNQVALNIANEGVKVFTDYWEANADGQELDGLDPWNEKPFLHNSTAALEMIYNYVEDRWALFTSPSFRIIEIEKPFAVPLDEARPNLVYVGRLDKVFHYQGRTYIVEHKTTSLYKKQGPFRSDFTESFSPNSQVDGYLYAGHLIYGRDLKALWIDAALVHKDEHDGFRFLPIERHTSQLGAWLWESRYYIQQIEANLEALAAVRNTDIEYLPAFPKDTSRCMDFGRSCPYLEICRMRPNPLKGEMPDGFVEHKWEPFEELELSAHRTVGGANRAITPGKDVLYDNTRIQDFRRCARYYLFRHVLHYTVEKVARPLLFGGGWHAAMDVIWRLCSGGDKHDKQQDEGGDRTD